jgi:hypothetical protein
VSVAATHPSERGNRESVGVQILYASDFAEHWDEHPDKGPLPAALCAALDKWSREHRIRR